MTLNEFLQHQRSALIRALDDPLATGFVAAHDAALLTRRVVRAGGSVGRIGRFRNAVCVTNKLGDKELWCRAQAGGYDAAFARFADQEFGFAFSKAAYPDHDVDHLFNRGRARKRGDPAPADPLAFTHTLPNSTMVRMVLVRSDVNRSFGSMLEKPLGGKNDGRRPYRNVTSMQLAKALNIHPNTTGGGLMSNGNLAHIAGEMDRIGALAALGVSRAEMLSELISQRDFAAR